MSNIGEWTSLLLFWNITFSVRLFMLRIMSSPVILAMTILVLLSGHLLKGLDCGKWCERWIDKMASPRQKLVVRVKKVLSIDSQNNRKQKYAKLGVVRRKLWFVGNLSKMPPHFCWEPRDAKGREFRLHYSLHDLHEFSERLTCTKRDRRGTPTLANSTIHKSRRQILQGATHQRDTKKNKKHLCKTPHPASKIIPSKWFSTQHDVNQAKSEYDS